MKVICLFAVLSDCYQFASVNTSPLRRAPAAIEATRTALGRVEVLLSHRIVHYLEWHSRQPGWQSLSDGSRSYGSFRQSIELPGRASLLRSETGKARRRV